MRAGPVAYGIIGKKTIGKDARMLTRSGKKLEEIIRKAIDDHEIRNSEYEEIIEAAHSDGMIDPHERVLLQELNELLSEKSVRRVPG